MSAARSDSSMSLAELSAYLCVSQAVVVDLLQKKSLPGTQHEREWRFQRKQIDAWLNPKKGGDVATEELDLPLGELMPDNAMVHDMRAQNAADAIDELAARAYRNHWLTDKPWFVGEVKQREALESTAMSGGVAFLHTRSEDRGRIARPFIVFGRSYQGIELGAADGGRTFLFFLLGLKHDRLHLPVLGRLSRLMTAQPAAVARLRATTSPSKMRHTLLALDADILAGREAGVAPIPLATPHAAEPVLRKDVRLRAIMRLSARRQEAQKTARKPAR